MLEINQLSARVGGKAFLRGIDLHLPSSTLTALVGRNGSGKSTLLSCIGGTKSYSGEILLRGEELRRIPLRERAKRMALLPQTLAAPHITVEELAALGRNPYVDIGRRLAAADREAVCCAMETAGVAELCGRFVDELSGGERQRAFLAMILAQETELLLLDEPTTYMDAVCGDAFMRTIAELRRQGKTLLVVMHDLTEAVRYADRVAVMEDGGMVFSGSTEECLASGVLEKTLCVKRYEAEGRSFFAAME